jgi:hypothetical protein
MATPDASTPAVANAIKVFRMTYLLLGRRRNAPRSGNNGQASSAVDGGLLQFVGAQTARAVANSPSFCQIFPTTRRDHA